MSDYKCFNTLCKGTLRKYPMEKLLSDPIESWECRYCYAVYQKYKSQSYEDFKLYYSLPTLNWADMYELKIK
jgi:hypothetical protein